MKIFKNAFINFVYPFQFDSGRFDTLRHTIQGAKWEEVKKDCPIWKTKKFTQPDVDLLPHVARYLNPADGASPTARLWELKNDALQSVRGGLGNTCEWTLVAPPDREIRFRIEIVQLTLFRVGVGFLMVRAMPTAFDVDDWLDFLHYFRFVNGQRGVKLRIDRRTGKSESQAFFPQPAGGTGEHPNGTGVFADIITALLGTAVNKRSEPWWTDVFVPGQILPFAAIYVDHVPQNVTDPLLYRVRKCFHARQPIDPSPDDLRADHPSLLPYTNRQWFTFSLDGGAFVAFDAPNEPFFREAMPTDHLPNQYFLLFILALHQRFTLIALSAEVADRWLPNRPELDDNERELVFRRIRDALLSFTARGMFTQVMQRENHHRCYRKWQQTFQIDALYQEVRAEVNEMHQYLKMRQDEKIQQLAESNQQRTQYLERLVTFIGLFIAAFSISIGALSLDIIGYTDKGVSLKNALTIGLGGGFTLFFLLCLLVLLVSRFVKSRRSDARK